MFCLLESRKKCSDISLGVSGDGIVKLGDTVTLTMGIPTDEDDRLLKIYIVLFMCLQLQQNINVKLISKHSSYQHSLL